jgi:glycosyltransferase involved in cell wall biosynthesis
MKILHCITGLSGDGAQGMLLRLARSLRSLGLRQEVVNLGPRSELVPAFEDADIPVHSLAMNSGLLHAYSGVRQLRRIISRFKPEVIQGWMYHANLMLLATQGRGRRRLPLLWNIRRGLDDYRELSGKTRFLIHMSAGVSSAAARILYCSTESRAQHEQLGFSKEAGVVVENGYDTDRFKPSHTQGREFRRENRIPSDQIVVGIVGRFDKAKGHEFLFHAFAEISKRFPTTTLLCVGRGMEWSNSELVKIIEPRVKRNQVVLLGEQSQPERIYPAMDLYCSSSIGEGFPNAVSEAMACGVPCVVTDTGASRHVVDDSGIVVPTRSSAALSVALTRMIECGATKRASMGARARARIERHFSLEAVSARYARLYIESATTTSVL